MELNLDSGQVKCRACLKSKSFLIHCKDTIPKIRNKNFPRRGIAGLSTIFHIHVAVSNLYIPTIGLPILLVENM
jgi:hypothetical protein